MYVSQKKKILEWKELLQLLLMIALLFMIAMPSRKTPTGTYRDIAHPINGETRKMFEDAIIDAYKEELKNVSE